MLWALAPAMAVVALHAPCKLPGGPMMTRPETVRVVVEGILTERYGASKPNYDFAVTPEAATGDWLVSVWPKEALGGGMTFRIDHCDGRISDVKYTR